MNNFHPKAQRRKEIQDLVHAGIPVKRSSKIYLCIFLLFFILLFSHPDVSAQNDSLRSYLEYAVRNNPGLMQKYTEHEAALQKVRPAGTLPDPQVNISYFLMPMELVNGRQLAEANIMQMFPWFGVLRNAKEEMRNMAFADFEEYRDQTLQVIYDVQVAWYELYRIRKAAELTGKNIEILKGIEEIAMIRYRNLPAGASGPSQVQPQRQNSVQASNQGGATSGMSGMTGSAGSSQSSGSQQQSMGMQQDPMGSSSGSGLADLYRIRMEAADLENSLSTLKDQERTIVAGFNILLDRSPDRDVFTADTLIADSLAVSAEIDAGSHAMNPMLGMYEYEKKAYEAREKMTRGMGKPMVGLGLGYSLIGNTESGMTDPEMNGGDMIMPMVSVTLPIWRKKYRAMRNEASLLAQSATHAYKAASNNLLSEHYQAIQSYNDAMRRINLNKTQYELASNTLDLLLTRFSVSSADLTDILRVRQQLLDYEMRGLEAVTDYNKAVAMLKRIMVITPVEITPKNE